MRWMVVGLVGCTAMEAEVVHGELEPYLELSPADVLERTRPLAGARASFVAGGPLFEGEVWSSVGKVAVVEPLEDVGVLWEQNGLRLVAWVPREDLPTVSVETDWFGGARAGGIRLPAGLEVDVVDTVEGRVRVQVDNGVLSVDAWAREAQVDHWWIDERPGPWTAEDGDPVALAGGIDLVDGPDGEGVANLMDERQLAWRVEQDGPWSRVQFRAAGWPVDAWVHEDDTSATGLFGTGYGTSWCSGHGSFVDPFPNVRAEATLFATPGGEAVGRTLRATRLELQGSPGGWREVWLATPFGETSVWVSPDDVL